MICPIDVQTSDDELVVYGLKKPDATFQECADWLWFIVSELEHRIHRLAIAKPMLHPTVLQILFRLPKLQDVILGCDFYPHTPFEFEPERILCFNSNTFKQAPPQFPWPPSSTLSHGGMLCTKDAPNNPLCVVDSSILLTLFDVHSEDLKTVGIDNNIVFRGDFSLVMNALRSLLYRKRTKLFISLVQANLMDWICNVFAEQQEVRIEYDDMPLTMVRYTGDNALLQITATRNVGNGLLKRLLEGNKTIQRICFASWEKNIHDLQPFETICKFNNLSSIWIHNTKSNSSSFAPFGQLTTLTELLFIRCPECCFTATSVLPLANLTNLETLILEETMCTNAAQKILLRRLTKLRTLYLFNYDDRPLSCIQNEPFGADQDDQIGPLVRDTISLISKMTTLCELSLQQPDITDDLLEQLLCSPNPLTNLDVSSSQEKLTWASLSKLLSLPLDRLSMPTSFLPTQQQLLTSLDIPTVLIECVELISTNTSLKSLTFRAQNLEHLIDRTWPLNTIITGGMQPNTTLTDLQFACKKDAKLSPPSFAPYRARNLKREKEKNKRAEILFITLAAARLVSMKRHE